MRATILDNVESSGVVIRAARTSDLNQLVAIELAAGDVFRSIGMDAIADDPPATVDQLAGYLDSAWVSVDQQDVPHAYLLAERIDDRAHIEQVTVHPQHSRRGIGAALIERANQWANEQSLNGLSLTTFAEVPWNAPYYSRLGFVALPEAGWTEGLRARVASEASHGLDAWVRVVMVR